MVQIQTDMREDMPRRGLDLRLVRDVALLAIGYFVGGYIGISLAVPPGYATIVWPASGVALCALLVRGSRVWPGVWLGSFALNAIMASGGSTTLAESWPAFAIATALGVGASLQAVAGLAMARRFNAGLELANLRRLVVALVLVVVLPCLIAPTIGVSTLLVAGAIDPSMVTGNWLTWYAGDVLGVSLILPILLLSSRSPVAVRWRGRSLQGASTLVALSLAGTLLLTFYAWQFLSEREYNQAEANLAAMAATTDGALRYRLEIYQRALEGGAAFVTVNGAPTPSEWREYVARLDIERTYPGMHGFGVFEEVADDDLAEFRQRFAGEFGDRFAVHPQVDRSRHFIINRVEPLSENLAALGLNLAFEEGRREAIALSTARQDPVLTRPIVLVQDEDQGAGFLLVSPILDEAGQPTGRWVFAPLVAEELFTGLTPQQGTDFAFEVFHGDEPLEEALLYASDEVAEDPRFEALRTISMAGQPFTLRWSSLRAFENRSLSSAPVLALFSGFTITILLGILLVIFIRRESHVLREVQEATAELAERNRMLELAEATAHIGHWHLDLATHQIRWSDEVHRLHGLEPGDTPELEKAIEFYHPDDRSIVEESLEAAMTTHVSYRFKARLLTTKGDLRHVEVRGRVETDEYGEPAALIGVIIDRTDETQMRERLTETIEEARAADRAKSSFLANMSHEIRTPMNGVLGFTELALAEEKVPEQKRRLQMIADSGNAMLRLLNDLLDFAKIEAKQMAIVSEPTDLRHTLGSCQRLMEPVARERGIGLILEIDPKVPARIKIDKMRLRQIVLNLLGNALKFTEEGEVQISASISRRKADEADMIFITVRDTGIGIAEDRLESIFGKFTQADDTTARRYGGTGLGLPISAELAELMGGELRAESEFGKGSVFILSLPFRESDEDVVSEPVAAPLETCSHTVRLKILIAEDNPVNQELTMAMVEKSGHDCSLARDGHEAVEAVVRANREGQPFDMVLMDMQMPNMDGLEASRAIRDAGIEKEALPIIAVTANAYSDDIQRCMDAGMQGHLAKPLRMGALCAAIGQWSPRIESRAQPVEEPFEQETDPRLNAMFADRKVAAIEAIDAAIGQGSLTEAERDEIAGLLHQIAGVAAYFGQQELGDFCRASQHGLKDAGDMGQALALLEAVRERLLPGPTTV
ncbi:CHASE domain-containing protein [Alteriqipengyuania lutimaris]|uniref:histidine kinase n=1 Tax=Alteriqipengyuania lutimaris TaxID=1538146 RepID=A0A395LLY4_9SPHN|nr:CHASE domain-containing protein [Alteriqipengyuania lutimaris]MBB3033606.1 PAS domain S-box-containing protein [Alteriqipengyuania lutimaris]RDS77397.1 response regulator [Alteriqipengyuania lutimaris]